MKITITNAYAQGSGGDMAILTSLICELRRVFADPELVVSILDDPSNLKQNLEGVHFIPSMIMTAFNEKSNRISKLLNLIESWLSIFAWSVVYRCGEKRTDWILKKEEVEIMNRLADSDLVVAVGGGYIRGSKGAIKIVDLALVLQMLLVSRMLGKKTVLHSQSIGPFGNKTQERLAAFVLNKMQLIIVRESISWTVLRKIGVKEDIIFQSTDAAFLIRKQNPAPQPIPAEISKIEKNYSGPLIGVTARQWLGKGAQQKYENEMAKSLDEIAEKYDAHIVFIPQVAASENDDDDRIVQTRIFEAMKNKSRATNITNPYDYRGLLAIYENLDFMIGTRFHSVIFTLISCVPALVIAYEHKANGIMEDLGLSRWVVKIEDVDCPALTKLFSELYMQKESYLQQLKKALPSHIGKAEKAVEKIREVSLLQESPQNFVNFFGKHGKKTNA